jgi:predicted phage terminase large subunit-like protein
MPNLSPELRSLLEEALARGLALPPDVLTAISGAATTQRPESFREFVCRVRPTYRWYKHCEALASVLQRVADGELRRVMVFMPPRHGKSELVSRLFSAYWLSRFSHQWVGLCSYGADLAYTLSRASRTNYLAGGGATRDDAAAVKHWETNAGGGLWAAGVGGPITGKGWSLGIIDDSTKNAVDAASEIIRERQKEWYRSTFYTREEPDPDTGQPDGACVVVQTRWHEDDLSGWLLGQETEDDEPERWHIVSLDAIHDGPPENVPATCTIEPDWREVGEALCPERRPLAKLKSIQARIGPYHWGALFQQRPRPREGGFFKRTWFKIVDASPEPIVSSVRNWDLAATEDGGDWTAGAKVGRTASGLIVIEDVQRFRLGPGARDKRIVATAKRDGREVAQRFEQEPGSGGKAQVHALVRLLAGFRAYARTSTGSKQTRADGLASQAEIGNVLLIRGPWNAAFIDELCGFPTGTHDDQVDAASGGFDAATKFRIAVGY